MAQLNTNQTKHDRLRNQIKVNGGGSRRTASSPRSWISDGSDGGKSGGGRGGESHVSSWRTTATSSARRPRVTCFLRTRHRGPTSAPGPSAACHCRKSRAPPRVAWTMLRIRLLRTWARQTRPGAAKRRRGDTGRMWGGHGGRSWWLVPVWEPLGLRLRWLVPGKGEG